jgi:exonuclease III
MQKKKIIMAIGFCILIIGAYIIPAAAEGDFHLRCFYKDKLKVMTRNLYLGADIFKVLEVAQNPDPALGGLDVPIAVAELFQTVQYTNFPERAEAIANEIWFHRPHLIGLQEVSKWYIQSPGDMAVGGTVQATDIVYDYLEILLDALAARGLHYTVAVSSGDYETNPAFELPFNADVELPMLTGFTPEGVPTFDDLRMVDRDVILVRADVDASNPMAAPYQNKVSETIGGVPLEFTRCWVAVDVDVCGAIYRFVNTHLEVASEPETVFRLVQAAQMQELLAILSYETKPIILVGDFNSSPEHIPGYGLHPVYGGLPYVPPYMQAIDTGYLDAWDLIFWPRDGFTSSFNETVDDPDSQLTERIDLVLVLPQDKVIKRVIGIVTGDNEFNITASGLWPSDHAGVVAIIKFYSENLFYKKRK